MASMDFTYDQQMRRFLLMFLRVFSGLQIIDGHDVDGKPTYRKVPCRYGSMSRMVAGIIRNNSENTIIPMPFITATIESLNLDREMIRTEVEDDMIVSERYFDKTRGEYTDKLGCTRRVQRISEVPYVVSMKVDILTSNEEHKWQIWEQLAILFNPSVNLQLSTNPYDKTALTTIELKNTAYTNRTIPESTNYQLDVMTLTFEVKDLWVYRPAKVTRQQLINQIVVNIGDGSSEEDILDWSISEISRVIITPKNHQLILSNNYMQLKYNSNIDGLVDEDLSWPKFFDMYGAFRENITQIRLRNDIEDASHDIIGTVAYHPTNDNILIWTPDVDTFPADTENPIINIIDPAEHHPGDGYLPAAANGQRYLVTSEVGNNINWGTISAKKNDIIEYNSGSSSWVVSFNAETNKTTRYVTNLSDEKKYKILPSNNWNVFPDGHYYTGQWRIII